MRVHVGRHSSDLLLKLARYSTANCIGGGVKQEFCYRFEERRKMAEYCEYMWDPNRGHMSSSLVRSIYDEEGRRFDKRDKKLAITIVRAILRGMPDVDLKHCTDEYITRFLLARKYRTEQAAALIAAYQAQLAHRQDIFGNLTARDPALQRALRAGIPGVLPARDRKGRCVLVILASQWDPIAVPALAVQRAIFLVLETLIQDPRNQQSGFVTVVDWSGFSLRQGGALGAAALRNLIAALRGRFPARFKAIHFLAAPLYVQATLALVKPFLDEKTRNKIYLHGNNLSTLHEHLPTDILPAELGGTGPAFNPGLWAEPVIHSAMKEAEFAAAKKDKEHAEKLERENLSTTSDCETIEARNADNEKRSLSEAMNITLNNYGKTINEQNEVFNKNNLELNFMNGRTKGQDITEEDPKVKSNVDVSTLDANKFERTQNGNCFRDDIDVIDNTSKIEANDGDLGNSPEHFKEDDLSLMELHSETNSNEFEMIPSRPDSDGSKDSSLDNRSERVFLNVAKNDILSEKTNLIA